LWYVDRAASHQHDDADDHEQQPGDLANCFGHHRAVLLDRRKKSTHISNREPCYLNRRANERPDGRRIAQTSRGVRSHECTNRDLKREQPAD
jgi:hypothetical protein